jgi:hypothetical protein
MNKWLPAVLLLLLISCKEKDQDPEKKFIPIRSFFENQVADVDTSLYPIIRLDFVDSSRTDTSYIRREDFRALAADFLKLPDISDKKYSSQYREETLVDSMLDRVIISYVPINPEKSLIQRQEMLIKQSLGNDQVKSIIVDYLINNRDSIVRKRMLWQMDRSFQVTTMKQKKGEPETISTMKVVWNEPETQ